MPKPGRSDDSRCCMDGLGMKILNPPGLVGNHKTSEEPGILCGNARGAKVAVAGERMLLLPHVVKSQ